MRRAIILALVFIAANLLVGWLHIQVFHSPFPFAAWVSVLLHVVGLILFPYSKVFNPTPNEKPAR